MKVTFVNDWQFLFSKQTVGGRLFAFSFVMVSFMRNVDPLINGFTFVVLGLGFSIKSEFTEVSDD